MQLIKYSSVFYLAVNVEEIGLTREGFRSQKPPPNPTFLSPGKIVIQNPIRIFPTYHMNIILNY